MTLSIINKLKFIEVFTEAAIALYLQGDWRHVFKYYSTRVSNQLGRRYKHWVNETDEHFLKVLEIFFDV